MITRRGPKSAIMQQIAFQDRFWIRFYLRLDTLIYASSFDTVHWALEYNPLIVVLAHPKEKEQVVATAAFTMKRNFRARKSYLDCTVKVSHDTNQVFNTQLPLRYKEIVCIEALFDFTRLDSLAFTLYQNGDSVAHLACGYFLPKEFIRINLINDYRAELMEGITGVSSYDGFEVSKSRPFTIPIPLPPCSVTVQGNQVVLHSRAFHSFYKGEIQKSVWWRVKEKEGLFSVFEVIEEDPTFFNSRAIPFLLDPGDFTVQVKVKNQFGLWSEWSAPAPFQVTAFPQRAIVVDSLFLSKKVHGKVIREPICPAGWYWINMHFKRKISWDSVSYALVWLNHDSYAFGHSMNKGGLFHSSSNYIFNLSYSKKKFTLFEKQVENSSVSTCLDSTSGIYAGEFFVDTLNNVISIQTRLLDSAKTGTWRISGCIKYRNGLNIHNDVIEDESNVFRTTFRVVPKRKQWVHWGLVILLMSLAMVFVLQRRRRGKGTVLASQYDDVYQKIELYIRSNLRSNLTTGMIPDGIKVSRDTYYAAMKSHQESFNNLLNRIRIEEAKKMMVIPGRTLAEIAYSVGYSDPSYFTMMFKKYQGILPTDFIASLNKGETA